MKRQMTKVASASLLGALVACAPVSTPSIKPAELQSAEPARLADGGGRIVVMPQQQTTPAISEVDLEYAKARVAHGRGELVEAAAHYENVLRQAPQHVGALNGVGVIHAQAGRTELALQMFDRALALAPQAAHLYSNAGYALLQAGRLDEARVRLSRAIALDPNNALAQQNLDLLAQATAQVAAAQPAPSNGSPRVVAVAPNVYELHLASGGAMPPGGGGGRGLALPGTVHADAAALPGLRGVRLEVANGVGIARLAHRTADQLAQSGMVPARLTNAKPYRQARTEIQYAPGETARAQALQARLPWGTTVVATKPMARGVQLRLVLGHDLDRRSLAAWLGHERPTLTARLAPTGGWILV